MAFVCRGQRKMDLAKAHHNVGPGSYQLNIEKQMKIPKAFVPFGTMETRSKDNSFKLSSLPGPGTYNIADNQNGQKIVVSSQTEDIKILQISRPHPVFKSGTQRFAPVKQEDVIPGPGDYTISRPIAQRAKMFSTNTTSSKPKIIQHLININKYQSIPSIPSNLHAYGYNQNQNNELQLNEPPIQVYKGEKQDKIGPGHYNNTVKQRAKGVSCWSQAKEKRWDENKFVGSVGPGAYDIKTVQSLYNYKPSAGFASKTLRTGDIRKGAILQQNAKKQNEKIIEDTTSSLGRSQMDSRVFSEKNPPSTMIDDESDGDEYEYIDDTTPGPGSYLEISEVKKFNKPSRPGVPCFGTGTKRFVQSTHAPGIGPGSYDPRLQIRKIKSKSKNNPPPKDAARFPGLINNTKVEEPGPGAYEPRNTMQDKLIYKIQRGYRGQFGSTQMRSKQVEDNEEPGPGEYDPQPIKQQKQALSVFKSSTQRRGIFNHSNVPAPGVYNTNNYDISTRIIKEEEDDPDLIIKKPGFGVGEKRFKQGQVKQEQFDDDDIIKQIQDKYREEKKRKMLKNSASFKSGEPRIRDLKSENPGPGAYYDGEQDHWNKRTYNILFADI